ncbi:MAG: hypothetical protein Q9168_002255 [Polycauliona sp. 1 TL-2023]
MGYKRDQNYDGQTFRTTSTGPENEASELPPPYTEEVQAPPRIVPALPPRTSAVEAPSSDNNRRRLLLIYVHGFTGNETSFQNFPTHVHDLIGERLGHVYTVQSIVYPKYKSRKKIEFARDEFSSWLREHESDKTDLILLGHSMGGLLAAEVALLPLSSYSAIPLRHRILGTLNLDAPFLGIHPGIVASGISSLFRKAPDQPGGAKELSPEHSMTPTSSIDVPKSCAPSVGRNGETSMLNSPAYSSNVAPSISSLSLESRADPSEAMGPQQSKLSKALYFVNKHSDGLTKATKSYLTSHIEFGGCLADYKGLMNRYSSIRALEDNPTSRVRFINYYTASTGRTKPVERTKPVSDEAQPMDADDRSLSSHQNRGEPSPVVRDRELRHLSPRASTDRDEAAGTGSHVVSSEDFSDDEDDPSLERGNNNAPTEVPDKSLIDLTDPPAREPPLIPSSSTASVVKFETTNMSHVSSADSLPPLPDPPIKPPPLDTSGYSDKDALKIASRDHDRAIKAYNRLVKDRDNAIKDRRRLLDKRAKAAEKQIREEERKAAKSEGKLNEKTATPIALNDDSGDGAETSGTATSEPLSIPVTSSPSISKPESTTQAKQPKPPKPPKPLKYRPFCLLPHQPDPTWVRVVMRDTDEIDAHCGLFAQGGAHYEAFVTAVVERIAMWTEEASISR